MADENIKTVGNLRVVNFPTTATLLAIGVVSLAFMAVVFLFYREIPKENQQPFSLVMGITLAWGGTVINYYFGDSKKSAQQQDTITSLAAAPQLAADLQKAAAEKQDDAADKQLKAAEEQKKDR